MRESTSETIPFPAAGIWDALTGVLRDGAQKLPAQAVDAAVAAYIEQHAEQRDEQGLTSDN